MQAAILAGGLGTRLWPLTKDIPKPMVAIAGKPYLEYQLLKLREQGITDIVLLTGYLGEQIADYFGSGERLDICIRYSQELSPLGTGGALRHAQHLLAADFLMLYGDSYLPIDYRAVLSSLRSSTATGAMVVYDNRLGDTTVQNNVGLHENGRVAHYCKSSAPAGMLDYVEAGVLAFRRAILDQIPAHLVVSLENEIFPKLIASQTLIAFVTRQRFYDIGTPERLKTIEDLLANDYHSHTV